MINTRTCNFIYLLSKLPEYMTYQEYILNKSRATEFVLVTLAVHLILVAQYMIIATNLVNYDEKPV